MRKGIVGSFRLRIILWTVFLSGLVLIAFGLNANISIFRAKLASIDERLRAAAIRNFPSPGHDSAWERYQDFLNGVGARAFGGEVGFFVYGKENDLFQSSLNLEGLVDFSLLPEVSGELPKRVAGGSDGRDERRLARGEKWDLDFSELRRRLREPNRGPRFLEGESAFISIPVGGDKWRFAVFKTPGVNLAIGTNLSNVREDMLAVRRAFLIALPVSLGILAIGAWFLASRAIRPVISLTDVASRISAQGLAQRIERGGADNEFADLIDVFNSMLERLEESFHQANRFSADAAHELKTPLAILQGHLELELQDAEDDSEAQRRLAMLLDEAQRLKTITQKLLVLSQVDAGKLKPHLEKVRLTTLLEEIVEDHQMHTEAIEFILDVDTTDALVDESLFRQIVNNLLGNSIKYNLPENGVVRLTLKELAGQVVFKVENTGNPIPVELRGAIFDRFSRGDPARNRSVEGVGLGLSLAREFAKAHGGSLELLPDEDGYTRFQLKVPSA